MQKVYRMLLLGVLVGLLSNCQAQQPIPTVVSQANPTVPTVVAQVSPTQPSATPTSASVTPTPALRVPTNERVLVQVNRPGVGWPRHYAWLTATNELTPQRLYEPILIFAIPNSSLMICYRYETLCLFDLERDQVVWEHVAPNLYNLPEPLVALDEDGKGVYIAFARRGEILDLPMGWWHVRLSDGAILEQASFDKLLTIGRGWLSATGDLWFQAHNSLKLWHYAPRDQRLTLASVEGFVTLSQQRLFVLANSQILVELNAVDGLPIRTIELSPPLDPLAQQVIVAPNLDQVAFGDSSDRWQIYSLDTGFLIEAYQLEQAFKLLPSYQAGYWYAYSNQDRLIKLWQPTTKQQRDLQLLKTHGQTVSHVWLWPEQPIPIKPLPLTSPTPALAPLLPEQPTYQVALFAKWWNQTYSYSNLWSDQLVEFLSSHTLLIERPGLPALAMYPRYDPDPQPDELWLYDPQTQTHRQIDHHDLLYSLNYATQTIINPNLLQALIVLEPNRSTRQLLQLDLTTNQLSVVKSIFRIPELRQIEPVAWNEQTLYAFLHDRSTSAFSQKSMFAKITLNHYAKIDILAELSYQPLYLVSANQQTLVYHQSQTASEQTLVWWNLTNQTSSTLRLPLASQDAMALAPDGSALAIVTFDSAQHMGQLKLYDHASKTWKVLDQQSSGHNVTTNPTLGWSADGVRLWWQRNLQQPLLTKEYRVYTATGAFQWADPLPLHNHSVVSADAETVVLVGVAGTMLQERKHGQITAQFGLPADLLEQRALAGVNR